MKNRTVLITTLGVLLLLPLVSATCKKPDPRLKNFKLGTDFTRNNKIKLRDVNKRVFAYKQVSGRPALLFFGFTHCPDICPGTLANIRLARKIMGAKPDQLPTLFVSVDPGRDTPEKIAAYLKRFALPSIGLTGSNEQLEQMARSFGASFDKRIIGKNYTMDHTAYVYLLDARGDVRYLFKFNDPPELMAEIAGSLL